MPVSSLFCSRPITRASKCSSAENPTETLATQVSTLGVGRYVFRLQTFAGGNYAAKPRPRGQPRSKGRVGENPGKEVATRREEPRGKHNPLLHSVLVFQEYFFSGPLEPGYGYRK